MTNPRLSDQDKIEEMVMLLDEVKCFMHKTSNTFEDYYNFALKNYRRWATASSYGYDLVPAERLEQLCELGSMEAFYKLREEEGKIDPRYGEADPSKQDWSDGWD